jgi:Domain of unknown function (DUF4188)
LHRRCQEVVNRRHLVERRIGLNQKSRKEAEWSEKDPWSPAVMIGRVAQSIQSDWPLSKEPDDMEINRGRVTAEIEGDFVVFLIGARPNPLRMIRSLRDLGGNKGMKHMLDYLSKQPEIGLLGYQQVGIGTWVQYWRSFDHLEAFAKNQDDPHLTVWRNYFKRVGSSGRTGIWHESFLVRAGEFEVIYTNMPAFGLAKASKVVPIAESVAARDRLKARAKLS